MSHQLEVRAVSHSFRGLSVLRGVNFVVPDGQIVGLIGPNGAGKSTLFNIISGFLEPNQGQVFFQGEDINRLSVPQRSQKGLLRSFQTPQVFARLTVRENLMAGCYKETSSGVVAGLVGWGGRRERRAMEEAASQACETFGLAGVRDRLAGKLPGGQQRLVELARAAVGKPKLLCLDEPSSGLNTEEVNQLMSMLRRMNAQGVTILLVSHDMDLVAVASEIHVLCFGEIIASGPFARLKGDARVREAYLGV
ncbi:MAG: ABC transporter ATP-binding protein [Betaproteobacteria bacterium]|nr:ABC transporter ATP-binding protein [Betaproteobacteria bacterium]